MALGATIYKIELNVADVDRHYYATHALRVARHPSETAQRMFARLVAFALHADEQLTFTRGISQADEPDIWRKDLTGAIDLWVEVGLPTSTRILKACGLSKHVVVYCYTDQGSKMWWDSVSNELRRAKNLTVISLPGHLVDALAAQTERSMVIHINIEDKEILVCTEHSQLSLVPVVWREASH
jgi:uncharacterized protein YaeQ